MTKIFLILMVVMLGSISAVSFAQQGSPGAPTRADGYNIAVKYPGDFKPNLLFFRFTQNDFWRRKPGLDRLRRITCPPAMDQLNRQGKWQGSLNADGSCGGNSVESPEWATGNRINFDEARQQRPR